LTLTGWTSVENLTLVNNGTDVTISATLLNTANLQTVTGNTTAPNNAVERLIVNGTNGNDTISVASVTAVTSAMIVIDGGAGNDSITGSLAADSIVGGNGDDTLIGGDGLDTLVGGDGADVFVFNTANDTSTTDNLALMDVIVDFDATVDSLNLGTGATGITLTTIAAGDGGSGDDYVLSWTNNGQAQYIKLADTGSTELAYGGDYDNGTGATFISPSAAVAGTLSFDVFTVTSTGIVVSGNGPFRVYLAAGTSPLRNDPNTYYTKSKNYGASQDHTFDFALLKTESPAPGETLGTTPLPHPINGARLVLQNTNDGFNTPHPTYIFIGDTVGATVNDTLTATAGQNSIIYGFGGNDTIVGASGNDTIFGGDGNDSITGGAGNDNITGGAGADTFVFAATAVLNGTDVITDFTTGADILNVDAMTAATAATTVTGPQTATAGVFYYLGGQAAGAADSIAGSVTALAAAGTWTDAAATVYILVSDDNSAALYQYTGDGLNNDFNAAEFTLMGTITGVVAAGDLFFGLAPV
jgi:Ca2+-binding RTX toxin-like protein